MTIQRDSQERFDVLVTPVVGEDPGVAVEMIDGKWLVVFGYPSYQTAIQEFEALSTRVALPDLAALRQRIASTLLQRLRRKQLMGCLDQSRFAVLFEDDGEREIRDQLLAISAALDKEVLAPLGDDPRLEASFGFAIFPRDAASAAELWTMGFQALADQTSNASVSSTKMRSA